MIQEWGIFFKNIPIKYFLERNSKTVVTEDIRKIFNCLVIETHNKEKVIGVIYLGGKNV